MPLKQAAVQSASTAVAGALWPWINRPTQSLKTHKHTRTQMRRQWSEFKTILLHAHGIICPKCCRTQMCNIFWNLCRAFKAPRKEINHSAREKLEVKTHFVVCGTNGPRHESRKWCQTPSVCSLTLFFFTQWESASGILVNAGNCPHFSFFSQAPCCTRHCVNRQHIVVNRRPSVLTRRKESAKNGRQKYRGNTENSCFDFLGLLYAFTIF